MTPQPTTPRPALACEADEGSAMEVRRMTKAQRIVLERLATGKWVMDRYGRDGMQARMSGPGFVEFIIATKTVSWLYAEGYISPSIDAITDWEITKEGRAALSRGAE